MNWKIIRQFPKYAIGIGVFVISTGLFLVWWLTRAPDGHQNGSELAVVPLPSPVDPQEEVIRAKVASLPDKIGWLALVGADLYDISTGERIFANWLTGIPEKLFYQPEVNRLMVQTERGLVRYGLDGKPDGTIGGLGQHAFSPDGKLASFVKDGDIWVGEIDWKGFGLASERQATRTGEFNAQYFAASVMMGSENALIVRNQSKILRVSLKTGGVEQIRLPLGEVAKRRSPDGRTLIGDARNIYVFDVEAADAYNFPESRWRAVDFQWLSNDACAFIVASKSVSLYDRRKNAIEELVTLPLECSKIAGPSPTGRYVLCAGRRGVLLLDVLSKSTEVFETPAENFGWVSDDTMIYMRNVPDSSLRGTWLKTAGQPERRVIMEPYIVGRDGSGAVDLLKELDVVVFGTREALYRMKPDGSELKEIAKLPQPVTRIQAVQVWGK